jgi:CspA family cold shock protein
MSNEHQTVVCQRCGCGFVLTRTYRDFLVRRGVKVAMPVQCMTCFLKAGPLPKQRGAVKWFSPRRRYGFITTGEGEEVFFHQNELLGGNGNVPQEGQIAQFHLRYSVKGVEAVNVELVSE